MISRIFALLAAVFCLSACAYILDSQQQQITFNTIAAKNAQCDVWVKGRHYKVYPPQTITINRAQEDLIVDCEAPGRREKKIVIPAAINDNTSMNITNAGIGLPYDYLTQSMFAYPERIEIDFTGQVARKQDLPAHNDPDLIPSEDYILDEYGPSTPRLNSDLTSPVYSLQRRTDDQAEGGYESYEDPSAYADKGDLMAVGTGSTTTGATVQTTTVPSSDFGPVVPNAMVNPGATPQPVPSYPGE